MVEIIMFFTAIILPAATMAVVFYTNIPGKFIRNFLENSFAYLGLFFKYSVPLIIIKILTSISILLWSIFSFLWMHFHIRSVLDLVDKCIAEGMVPLHNRHLIEHVLPAFFIGGVVFICSFVTLFTLQELWESIFIFYSKTSVSSCDEALNILKGSNIPRNAAELLAFEQMDLEISKEASLEAVEKSSINIEEKKSETWSTWALAAAALTASIVIGISYYVFYK